ncbi:hypothetical protein J6590_002054 [Homalodisca vitripennis]|nr:hypothetical protein J6590_002054 [Homalodisca vitripennis]
MGGRGRRRYCPRMVCVIGDIYERSDHCHPNPSPSASEVTLLPGPMATDTGYCPPAAVTSSRSRILVLFCPTCRTMAEI